MGTTPLKRNDDPKGTALGVSSPASPCSVGDKFTNDAGDWIGVVELSEYDVTYRSSFVVARVRCQFSKFEKTIKAGNFEAERSTAPNQA